MIDSDSELIEILAALGSYRYINNENEEVLNYNINNINKNINSVGIDGKKLKKKAIEDEKNINKIFECGEDCLDAARALYRMLNEDDDIDRSIFHFLGRNNIARSKLVPILITYPDNTNLVITILKIFVKLTLQLPYHIESYDIPKQTLYTLDMKESFLNRELIKTLLDILKEPMINLGFSNGSSQDYIIIELVLTLIKNMLQIQDPISSQTSIETEYRCHMHSNLIELLEEENILELFLVLAQNIHTNKVYKQISIYSLLLLEIFTLLLKNESPNEIWSSQDKSQVNKNSDDDDDDDSETKKKQVITEKDKSLINLLKKEKRLSTKLVSNSNRSRFIGTYTSYSDVDGKKIINKTLPDMVAVNSIRPATLGNFSASLLASRTKVIGERKKTTSSLKVRLVLKSWAEQFLDGCYNTLMNTVVDEFAKENAQILDSDRLNFLMLTKFFTGFSLALLRHHNEKVEQLKKKKQLDKELDDMVVDKSLEPQSDDEGEEDIDAFTHDNIIGSLSSTLSPSNFQFIFSSCSNYQMTKKHLSLEVAVSTLREMISLLNYMSVSPIEQYKQISLQMQSTIYYDHDAFLKLVISLMRIYDPNHYSKSMMLDLIDLSFTTVVMVENFCKLNNAIEIKSKRQRSSKSLNSIDDDVEKVEQPHENPDGTINDDGLPDEEEKEDEHDSHVRTSMDFTSFMAEFAHSEVIKNLALVLGGYHGNSTLINHQIIQLYKRIANDLELEPMFYQLSLFYLFKNLLNDPLISSSKSADSKDLLEFINQILTKYYKAVESDPSFLIDILIPKTRTDCFYLKTNDEEGSDQQQQQKSEQQSQQEFDENGIPILEISKNTGRLKKKSNGDSDEGETFLESDEDEYILQNIVSKMEDALKRPELIEKIKLLNKRKVGPKIINWLQQHLLNAIVIRTKEKNNPSFTLYPLLYEGDCEGENYNNLANVRQIFSLLKFGLPTSRNGFYTISSLKNYSADYLTAIYETIKEALEQQKLEIQQKESEKQQKKLHPKQPRTKKSTKPKGRKQIVAKFDKNGKRNPLYQSSDEESNNESKSSSENEISGESDGENQVESENEKEDKDKVIKEKKHYNNNKKESDDDEDEETNKKKEEGDKEAEEEEEESDNEEVQKLKEKEKRDRKKEKKEKRKNKKREKREKKEKKRKERKEHEEEQEEQEEEQEEQEEIIVEPIEKSAESKKKLKKILKKSKEEDEESDDNFQSSKVKTIIDSDSDEESNNIFSKKDKDNNTDDTTSKRRNKKVLKRKTIGSSDEEEQEESGEDKDIDSDNGDKKIEKVSKKHKLN
ncbi:hypothetical protein ACTFIU_003400 [Dictyostelium citrinum]